MKYVVTVNGERYEVEVERAGGGSTSLSRQPIERGARSQPMSAPAAAPVAAQPVVSSPTPVSSGGLKTVVSPMPGTVLDIKVKEGDVVAVGDVMIILEAMKMETEIVTEHAGTVSAIKVKKGDAVETDTVLVEIR
ncbi:biotin/lipoyl-containing protein [Treponema phagedenis]|uniref:biotin/lipoyl-containing protein n=1 Tax=Treponema phagedenis TaxID=162 RepID=UPI0001F6415D|nr:biotin/lipoyl-containing protein [Treponema phagedenis]EFW38345.1 putative glutaconyl-CoA decarboxylase subunit gamma [Treponema phagedenis F0421]TYT78526.1 biotin/lipoyl-binding protein [Treponema phagedenis]